MLPIVLLAVFSLAMVAAMVEYSRAYWLEDPERRRRWGFVYFALWVAIFTVLVNLPEVDLGMIALVCGGYLAMHFVILRFGLALRGAGVPPAPAVRRLPRPPRPPSKPISRFWFFAVALALLAIATVFNDTLAANRDFLVPACISLIALGFALFMGGILHLLLKPGRTEISLREMKQWHDPDVQRFYVITGGVFLMLAAGTLLMMVLWSGAVVTDLQE